MDLSFLTEYINYIAVAICLCVGWIVKNIVPGSESNRFIPLVVGILGVAIVCWAEMAFTPEAVCAGLVSGLASTGLYEAFGQMNLLRYERKVDGMATDPIEATEVDDQDGE